MRGMIGAILMLVGGAVVLLGIGLAVKPVIDLYRANLDDPMGQPEGAERRVPLDMRKGLIVGAAGVVPFMIGSVLVKMEVRRRLRAALLAPKEKGR